MAHKRSSVDRVSRPLGSTEKVTPLCASVQLDNTRSPSFLSLPGRNEDVAEPADWPFPIDD